MLTTAWGCAFDIGGRGLILHRRTVTGHGLCIVTGATVLGGISVGGSVRLLSRKAPADRPAESRFEG